MQIEEIRTADIDTLEARKAAILEEDKETLTAEELEERATEAETIEARMTELAEIEAKKVEEREAIANGDTETTTIKTFEEERHMEKTFEEIRSSQEYLDAFAKMVKTGKDEEVRSLATELASGTIPVPTSITSYVENAWAKLGLANRAVTMNVKGILKVPYEVSADPAVVHAEGAEAPAEENLVFGSATLTPETIKKWITITDEALSMSSADFLKYIYDEITYQIMLKLDNEVVAKIKASALTDKTVASAAFDASTIFKGLAKLADSAVNPIAIMTKDMFFNKAMALVDGQGRPIYNIVSENGKPVYSINGVEVVFNASAGTDIIVGDMRGFTVNYQNGQSVDLITDPYSLAEQDKVKIVGKVTVGLGVTKPAHFAVLPITVG